MIPFKEFLSVLQEPAFIVDRERTILETGEGVGEMGYRGDYLRGKSIESIVAPPFRRTLEAMLDTAFRLGRITTSKVDILNAFGESVPVEVRVSPIEDKGRVRFFVIFYPVSNLNYEVLDKIGVPIWTLNRKGTLIFYNEAARKILPHLRSPLLKSGQEVEVEGVEFTVRVYDVVDGFNRVKMVALSAVCSEYNPYIKRFAVAGILSALAAHDVKNAIASLLLLSDLIEDESLKNKIHSGIMRVYRIHKRILNLARGRREVSRVPLREVLDEVKEDLRSKLLRKNVEIVSNFPENFEVETDRDALYEILLNLISNAIDVSSPGGKVVVSAGLSHDLSFGKVNKYVSVRDFGPGIPPDKVNRIFDLFFTSKKEGSGLGLFIVKTLSENIGVKLSVKSEPGKGTEFILLFPSNEVEESPEVSKSGSVGSN